MLLQSSSLSIHSVIMVPHVVLVTDTALVILIIHAAIVTFIRNN